MKAESTIQRHSKKKETFSEEEPEPEDIASILDKKLDEKLGKLRVELNQANVEAAIGKVSTSPAEAEHIKYHLENTIRPTGDLETDIRNAKAIANQKRIFSENEELRATLRSRESKATDASPGKKLEEKKELEIPADVKVAIDNATRTLTSAGYNVTDEVRRRLVAGESIFDLKRSGLLKRK